MVSNFFGIDDQVWTLINKAAADQRERAYQEGYDQAVKDAIAGNLDVYERFELVDKLRKAERTVRRYRKRYGPL